MGDAGRAGADGVRCECATEAREASGYARKSPRFWIRKQQAVAAFSSTCAPVQVLPYRL